MLREMVEPADFGFVIKIDGCEAGHDINQFKLLNATGIIATMSESSPFAVTKFQGAVEKIYGKS